MFVYLFISENRFQKKINKKKNLEESRNFKTKEMFSKSFCYKMLPKIFSKTFFQRRWFQKFFYMSKKNIYIYIYIFFFFKRKVSKNFASFKNTCFQKKGVASFKKIQVFKNDFFFKENVFLKRNFKHVKKIYIYISFLRKMCFPKIIKVNVVAFFFFNTFFFLFLTFFL